MPPKAQQLHNRLQHKHHGEDDVEDLEALLDSIRLVVVLDGHNDHVERNEHHNGQLKLGAHGNVIEKLEELGLQEITMYTID